MEDAQKKHEVEMQDSQTSREGHTQKIKKLEKELQDKVKHLDELKATMDKDKDRLKEAKDAMDLMNDHRKKIRKLQGDLKANNVKLEEKDLLNKQYKSEIEDLRSSLQVNSDLLGKMTKHEEETQKAEKDKEGKEEDLEREINRLKQSLYKEEVRSQGLYQ